MHLGPAHSRLTTITKDHWQDTSGFMDFTEFNIKFLFKFLTNSVPLVSSWNYGDSRQRTRCLSLKSTLALENTTILDVSYVSGGSTVKLHGDCGVSKAFVSASLCRVQFSTSTSDKSSIRAEAWLPDEWYGRFLGVGNGGLGGCIAYEDLNYGSALHFATVGSNNGHDGDSGRPFLENPEVLNDFAFRSIHVEAVIGKQILEVYYGRPHDKAYYLGCSTGGRQGTQSALKYPTDWDGIIAGAPATDFNHLLHWSAMLARYIGSPNPDSSPEFIPPDLWKLVAGEILNQCDGIDGVRDGIITEPDACNFRPEALLCAGPDSEKCLSLPQVEALRKIYSPLYDNGELIYPRYDPGAESIHPGGTLLSGQISNYAQDWLKYAVLNVTEFDFSNYGPEHGRMADDVNPGGIATFNGDLSAFRDRGGKFLTYHGRLIASGNSKRVYDLVSRTLAMPSLDAFYRLFLIPGMGHCALGPGAWAFGQLGGTEGARNESSHNVLLALVDWVEGGVAPDTITGTAVDGTTRVHCRYPMRSVWNGTNFVCEG
ncbi:Carboxylic ester hydrolase [Mycena venus]|uniref:Carboxylic ester hydrolase n=1 Tax=Mycena venus TaxID=2733690 RepID=A0A8H7CU47_9AGAR|nr:Carboxylic ester hydrolase [Mycena venus]